MEIKFKKEDHTYWLGDKRLTRVTSVLQVISKPALISWSAREAVKYIKENYKGELTEELLKEAEVAHTKKRDKAAESGTGVHALIEDIIKAWIKPDGIFVKEQLDRAWQDTLPTQVQHFVDWARKNNVKFLECEKVVYSKSLFLAGTYDFKCEIDGKIFIGDIKTSSGIYGLEPFMQTAAYEKMEREMEINNEARKIKKEFINDGVFEEIEAASHALIKATQEMKKLDGRLIINLKKSGVFDEDKDVYYRYDFETDWKAFEAAYILYKAQKTWKR